jgi:DNA polymerase III epsilon subunit-like protein
MNPSILFLDTENAPCVTCSWGIHDQKISEQDIIQDWFFLSAQWAWNDAKKINVVSILDDKERFAKRFSDDFHVVKTASDVMREADIIVGHNIKGHDLPKLKAKIAEYGLKPFNAPLIVDTLQWAREFGFTSRTLRYLCQKLSLTEKLTHSKGAFVRAAMGDPAAIREIVTYGKGDIEPLRKLYYKLRPYAPNHPNMNIWRGKGVDCCPRCSSNNFIASGFRYTAVGRIPRNECKDCGKFFDAGKHDKRVRMR